MRPTWTTLDPRRRLDAWLGAVLIRRVAAWLRSLPAVSYFFFFLFQESCGQCRRAARAPVVYRMVTASSTQGPHEDSTFTTFSITSRAPISPWATPQRCGKTQQHSFRIRPHIEHQKCLVPDYLRAPPCLEQLDGKMWRSPTARDQGRAPGRPLRSSFCYHTTLDAANCQGLGTGRPRKLLPRAQPSNQRHEVHTTRNSDRRAKGEEFLLKIIHLTPICDRGRCQLQDLRWLWCGGSPTRSR